jgi:bacterioferritin-associated ferredoxin
MFICLCNGITDRQIRDAAATGIATLDELRAHLGVASQCGQCGDMAKSLLSESFGDLPADRFYAAAVVD